jgi:hypothetical protein
MGKKDLKQLVEAYKKIVKEDFFDSYDHEERDDSWYYEDGAAAANQVQATVVAPKDKQATDYNKSMAPQHFDEKPFNAYECCNRILLSCENRLEVIEMFCKLIDHLTCDCEENQAAVKDFVSRIAQ